MYLSFYFFILWFFLCLLSDLLVKDERKFASLCAKSDYLDIQCTVLYLKQSLGCYVGYFNM